MMLFEKILQHKRHVPYLAVIIPAVCLLILVLHFTVNVPLQDQWEMVPLFQKFHLGTLGFHDLWLQHNEHRILFPNIVLFLSAIITHWNIRVESLLCFMTACLSFLILIRVLERTTKFSLKNTETVILLLLLSLIWFSPVQQENWLWGWQLEWFFNILGVVGVGYCLSQVKDGVIKNKYLVLLIACAIFAEYSLGSGLLVWPLVLAALLYKKVSYKKITVVGLVATATIYLYFLNYVSPHGPSKTLVLHKPLEYIVYVLSYLGRPLVFVHELTPFAGGVLVLVFGAVCMLMYKKDKEHFYRLLPWIFFGLYAIGAATITGLARLGLGLSEGLNSRYTTVSLLLLVSTLVIVWDNHSLLIKTIGGVYKKLSKVLVVSIFCLVTLNIAWGVRAARIEHRNLLYLHACTIWEKPIDACLLIAYPDKGTLIPRLEYLKSIHWGGY